MLWCVSDREELLAGIKARAVLHGDFEGGIELPLPAERGGPLSAEDAHTLVQWVLSQ